MTEPVKLPVLKQHLPYPDVLLAVRSWVAEEGFGHHTDVADAFHRVLRRMGYSDVDRWRYDRYRSQVYRSLGALAKEGVLVKDGTLYYTPEGYDTHKRERLAAKAEAEADQRRWELVHDNMAAFGFDSKVARGFGMGLTLKQWEELVAVLAHHRGLIEGLRRQEEQEHESPPSVPYGQGPWPWESEAAQ